MISSILLVLHIIVCAALILVVLLQSGKGGGLAGAFGGAGGQTGQTLFGGRGAATVLTKASTVLGIVFLTTSLILALLASRSSGPSSVIREAQAPGTMVPAVDAPSPVEVGLGTEAGEQALPAAGEAGQQSEPDAGAAPQEGEGAGTAGSGDQETDTP